MQTTTPESNENRSPAPLQRKLDALTRDGICPDCGGWTFRRGPSGGLTDNIKCVGCGSRFNFCPPCWVMPLGFAERI